MDLLNGMTTLEQGIVNGAAKKKIPVNGVIELLPLCNMNCDMCYVRLSQPEMEQRSRLHTAEEWLQIAEQMQKVGTLFLLLTGGEPLLYPDFKKLFVGLKNLGMILTVNTNGTMLDEKWAEFFGRHKPRRINITLYGASQETYKKLCHYPQGFNKVIQAIRLLKLQGVDVRIGGSITRTNQKDIPGIFNIAHDLQVPVRVDTYMMPATREREMPFQYQTRMDPETAAQERIRCLKQEMGQETFVKYQRQILWEVEHILPEKEPQPMTCYAGKSSFTINWMGEMQPCVILNYPKASVFELGFENAWYQIVKNVEKIRLNSKCSGCNLRPICRTCGACALLETGRYDGVPKYMCRYAKESLRLLKEEAEQ